MQQIPNGHVKTLIDLTLIDRAVTKVGDADWLLFVFVGKRQTTANRNLRTNNAAKEFLFPAEHVHRAALAA